MYMYMYPGMAGWEIQPYCIHFNLSVVMLQKKKKNKIKRQREAHYLLPTAR